MLATKTIADWVTALPATLTVPFTPGPEILEFGNADLAGTITKVPGGQGERRQGTFEQLQILYVIRGRSDQYVELEKTAVEHDTALMALRNVEMWGTYVLYVQRQGTVDASFEEPERVSFIANYAIEIGL